MSIEQKIERLTTTSIQLTNKQFKILETIKRMRNEETSNAQIIREAFDLYISIEYPQLKIGVI